MPTITRGSQVIDYTDIGQGPATILLHSSVAGNRQWKILGEQIQDRFRVIAPNLHGYGKTTPWSASREKLTLGRAAQPVLDLIEGIDGPINLVGHSWGGAIALAIAAKLGSRVSRLVVFEPMLSGLLRELKMQEHWQDVEALYKDVKRLGGKGDWLALAERFTDYFNGDGAWAATPEDRKNMIATLLEPNYFEWDALEEQTPFIPAYAAITAETLVIRSANTRPALSAIFDALREHFPKWQYQEIRTGGHMAPLMRPDLVNPLIADFLSR